MNIIADFLYVARCNWLRMYFCCEWRCLVGEDSGCTDKHSAAQPFLGIEDLTSWTRSPGNRKGELC
jgi:hypothetical protein